MKHTASLTRREALVAGSIAGTAAVVGSNGFSAAQATIPAPVAKNGGAYERPWEVAPEPIAESDIVDTVDVDIVVIS